MLIFYAVGLQIRLSGMLIFYAVGLQIRLSGKWSEIGRKIFEKMLIILMKDI